MKYRDLGNTGMKVSSIGLGSGGISSLEKEVAVPMIRRALEMGVNYIDTARGYGIAELNFGIGIKGRRENLYVSSKTQGKTKEEAWRDLHESLERLQIDYLDNYHLHCLVDEADLEARLAPGGALEALIEAKEQGLIRHIGCTSHTDCRLLIQALERFNFEIILVPLNVVEREALDELIPYCNEKGVGITIMKPVATGLLPAAVSLKWILNQPVATAVPGPCSVTEVEENTAIGCLNDISLSPDEEKEVEAWTRRLDQVRCRICMECEPCPKGIPIANTLGTFSIYEKYRNMGRETFAALPWAPMVVEQNREQYPQRIKLIESCDDCGLCVEKCPHDLPIPQMLRELVPAMQDILKIWDEAGL